MTRTIGEHVAARGSQSRRRETAGSIEELVERLNSRRKVDPDEVIEALRLLSASVARLEAIVEAERELLAALAEAAKTRRRLTATEIADAVGVSRQRLYRALERRAAR